MSKSRKSRDALSWHQIFILISGITGFVLSMGVNYSFGVYYVVLSNEFGTSKQTVGWLGSINMAIMFLMGPFTEWLRVRYGAGKVMGGGCVLAVIGHLLSSMATHMWQLMLTYGVISGLGFGLYFLPSINCVQEHFRTSKYVFVAVSLVTLGSVIGLLVFPPLHNALIIQYGWQGSMLVTAAILCHMLPCAMLFATKPPVDTSQTRVINDIKSASVLNIAALQLECREKLNPQNSKYAEFHDLEGKKRAIDDTGNEESATLPVSSDSQSCSKDDARVYMKASLSRLDYLVFQCHWPLNSAGTVVYIQLVDHVINQGHSLEEGLPLYLTMNVANALGRLASPVLLYLVGKYSIDIARLNYKAVIVCTAASGVATAFIALTPVTISHGMALYHLYNAVFGFARGGHMSMYPNLVLELFGSHGFARTISHSMFSDAFGTLLAPPVAGLLYDATRSYTIPLLLVAICILLSVPPVIAARFLAARFVAAAECSKPRTSAITQ